MIEPLFCRCICGTAARAHSQVPPTLVRNTASQSAGIGRQHRAAAGEAGRGHQHIEPAVPRHDVADDGLGEIGIADIADMRRCLACTHERVSVSCKRLRHRDRPARRARLPRANSIALARPMPEPAPVMMAVRPCSRMSDPLLVLRQPGARSRPPTRRSRTARASRIHPPSAPPTAARDQRPMQLDGRSSRRAPRAGSAGRDATPQRPRPIAAPAIARRVEML